MSMPGEELDRGLIVEHVMNSTQVGELSEEGLRAARELIVAEPAYPHLLRFALDYVLAEPSDDLEAVNHMRKKGVHLMAARLKGTEEMPCGLLAALGTEAEAEQAAANGFSMLRVGLWVMRCNVAIRQIQPLIANEQQRSELRRALYRLSFVDVDSPQWQDDEPGRQFGVPVHATTRILPIQAGPDDITEPFDFKDLETVLARTIDLH